MWSGILLAAVLVGVVVLAVVRRMLTGRSSAPNEGFTLNELRELYRAGRLTEAEYQRAKAAIIARSKAPPPGAEEDPAVRAVRELKARRQSADGPPGSSADKPVREDEPETTGESRGEPTDSV